ncbi:hypothetical protein [Agrococcus sp. DT81.2]|uniref:hypothetical protein n=1 Tax=Agrococcus sp. DT81.2 TaxID=3393414 RepID=UPI003CE48AC2
MDTGYRTAATASLVVAALTLSACAASPPRATSEAIATQEPVATASASAAAAAPPSRTPRADPHDCVGVVPAATVDSYIAQGLVLNPARLDTSWYDGPLWLADEPASTIAADRHVVTCIFTTELEGDGVSSIEVYAGLDDGESESLAQAATATGWTSESIADSVSMLWTIDPDPNTEHREAWVLGGDRWLRVSGNLRQSEQVAREVAAAVWELPAVAPPSTAPPSSCETLVPQRTVEEHASRGLVLTTPDDIDIVANHTVASQGVSADHRLFTCLFAPPGSRDRMVIIQFHSGLDAADIDVLQAAADEDIAFGYEAVPVAGTDADPVFAYVSETTGVTAQDVQVFHGDTWVHFFTHQEIDVMPAVSQIATRIWG